MTHTNNICLFYNRTPPFFFRQPHSSAQQQCVINERVIRSEISPLLFFRLVSCVLRMCFIRAESSYANLKFNTHNK